MGRFGSPAPRPCDSCPYRRNVPSGVWEAGEYAKLPLYDLPTQQQPHRVFTCHQQDGGAESRWVCAGWAGCHDGDELIALRLAVFQGLMTAEEAEAVRAYVSPVPLFSSGQEAADHGTAEIDAPGPEAAAAITKITRVRTDLRPLDRKPG